MNHHTNRLIRLLHWSALLVGITIMQLQAATIQWGGQIDSEFFLSDGTQVSSTNTPAIPLTFELGTFQSGFTPTEANVADWRANWNILDTADFSLTNQFYSGEFVFEDQDTGTAGVQFNGSTFTPGEDTFIWGYNQLGITPDLEWSLITGISALDDNTIDATNENWELPDPATSTQGTLPLQWRTSTANTAIFGSLGSSVGDGIIDSPQTGDFQFGTIIPEPSISLYCAFTFLAIFFYRHRN